MTLIVFPGDTPDVQMGDWNLQDWKKTGLENDGIEQEQTYILHTMKSFSFSHKCPGLVGSSSRLQF